MKITALTIVILMTGTVAKGDSAGTAAERKVIVCVEGLTLPLVVGAGPMARTLASQIFDDIGVTIDWRRGVRGCPAQGIQISLILDTPISLIPGALAYALPYEGTHICVFFDRIKRNPDRSQVPIVLAHVLVHEITHILQGITRHSASGIMKARWNAGDYGNMIGGSLRFEANDIDLIYQGLARRANRDVMALNVVGVR